MQYLDVGIFEEVRYRKKGIKRGVQFAVTEFEVVGLGGSVAPKEEVLELVLVAVVGFQVLAVVLFARLSVFVAENGLGGGVETCDFFAVDHEF